MQLIFSRSRSPASILIRLGTWSTWSHVAVILGGDQVIDATWRFGVATRALRTVIDESSHYSIVGLDADNPLGVINALRSQLGKPYDISAVTGLALRRNWQEDDAWFCSELLAWAWEKSGQPLFHRDSRHRVTPQNIWMLPR